MDMRVGENDYSRIIEADKAHVWHHLSQHKKYETVDPLIIIEGKGMRVWNCLLYTSPSPRDRG